MPLSNAAAGFIGASVTLVLVIIFMILIVILVRQCLAFVTKRNMIRNQLEQQRQIREQMRERRGSVSEPIPATFDWHHTIRIEGTPPPSYGEAKDLPALDGEGNDGRESTEQSSGKGVENSKEGEAKVVDGTDDKKPAVQNNGVHLSLPAKPLEVAEVHVEDNIIGENDQQAPTNQARTFITNYTEFNSHVGV